MTPVPSYLAQTYWWAYVHPTGFGGLYQLAIVTVPEGNAP